MEKFIACCGIDCATCDARKATVANDQELRIQTAESWKLQFSADITPEMINCTGCREEGIKFSHCAECEIRNCARSKGFQSCGECSELEQCSTIGNILQFVPDALTNLKSLN